MNINKGKFKDIIDFDDLKVKFIIGEYHKLDNVPQPDDVVYYMVSKNKSTMAFETIVDFFGIDKKDIAEKSIAFLVENGYVSLIDGKVTILN